MKFVFILEKMDQALSLLVAHRLHVTVEFGVLHRSFSTKHSNCLGSLVGLLKN